MHAFFGYAVSYNDPGTGANTLLLQLTCGEAKGTPGPVTAVDQSTGWQAAVARNTNSKGPPP